MELPENVVPMPAEQRADLRAKAIAAQKTWASNIVGWHPESNLWEYHDLDNEDAAFIAAIRPDTALATLDYVEALEAEVRRLGKELNDYTEAFRKRRQEWRAEQLRDSDALAEATARATKAESRADGLRAELAEQEREKLVLVQDIARKERVLMLYHRKMFAMLNIGQLSFSEFEAGWGATVDLMDAQGRARLAEAAKQMEETRPTNEELSAEIAKIDAPTPPPSSPAAAGPGILSAAKLAAFGYEEDEREPNGPQLTEDSALNLARMDYWRYQPGAEKPKVNGRGWAFPNNAESPTGWNVYTGPALQYVGSENLLCVVKIERGEPSFKDLDEDTLLEDPKWFSPLVFDSAAEYDASVASVTQRIESGEVKAIEPDECRCDRLHIVSASDYQAGAGFECFECGAKLPLSWPIDRAPTTTGEGKGDE